MERQLYLFLMIIAGVTSAYFSYDYISLSQAIPASTEASVLQAQHLKMSLIISLCTGSLAIFFVFMLLRSKR